MTGTTIAVLASLLGIYWVAFWLYRDYRVDRFRENLFSIRERLFDFAADDEIAFDHEAYVALRELINRYIRFAHRVRILPGALFASSLTDEEKRWLDDRSFDCWWDEATADLEVPTARVLYGLKNELNHQLQMHVILGSPTIAFTVIPAVVLIVAVWLPVEIARKGLGRMTESFEMAARDLGRAT